MGLTVSSRVDLPQTLPAGDPDPYVVFDMQVIGLSATRVVVMLVLVDYGASPTILRLILLNELGIQVAVTDVPWIGEGVIYSSSLDGALPSTYLARSDDTHLIEVNRWDALLYFRRIAVTDDGFTVDYDVSPSTLPDPGIIATGYFSKNYLVAMPDLGVAVNIARLDGTTALVVVDIATGEVLAISTETFSVPVRPKFFVDADKITLYWREDLGFSNYRHAIQTWTVTPSSIVADGPAVVDPALPGYVDGSTAAQGSEHVNPSHTAGVSTTMYIEYVPPVIFTQVGAVITETVPIIAATELDYEGSGGVGPRTSTEGSALMFLTTYPEVGLAEVAVFSNGIVEQAEVLGWQGFNTGCGTYANLGAACCIDAGGVLQVWMILTGNTPNLSGGLLGVAVHFTG